MCRAAWILGAAGIAAALAAVPAHAGADRPSARTAPLFIENVGQLDAAARFQMRGGAGTLWLAEDAVWLALAARAEPGERAARSGSPSEEGVYLRLTFPGSNPRPGLQPFDRSPTHVSYFLGNDPSRWQPDVPVWGGVRYVDLYPGVDLELRGRDGVLEPRLLVHPGADVGSVRLRVEGAESVTLKGDRLGVRTAIGDYDLPLLRLVASDGSAIAPRAPTMVGTDEIAAPFARGVEAAARAPLAGGLIFSTFVGGEREDLGQSIALDASGAAYVTGFTLSTEFPTTPGPFQPNCGSCTAFYYDAFVTKVSPDGSTLVYSTYLGGNKTDCFYSYAGDSCTIAVDGSGSAYIGGYTLSANFPTTPGAFDTTCNSCDSSSLYDAFVTKLNPTGTALVYSTYLGGGGSDTIHGIALDGSGAAYVTGRTTSPGFPTTPGALQPVHLGGGYDSFVTKLNPGGSALVYSTFLGGGDDDCHVFGAPAISCGIAVDAAGHAYVTGSTQSDDFPITPGAFQTVCGHPENCFFWGDAYVSKLNPSATALVYSTYLGGELEDYGMNLAVDAAGHAYVTGSSQSSDFPTTPGAFQTSFAGNSDAFVTKLNPTGTALVYSTYLGGSHGACGSCGDYGYDVAVDAMGTAAVTGYAGSFDFPVTAGAFQPFCGGPAFYCGDVFASRLSPDGDTLLYSTYLGGDYQDQGAGIAFDAVGTARVTGYTSSVGFPITPGAAQTVFGGYSDVFVTKLSLGGCTIMGTAGDDILIGTSGDDVICGLGGNDRLSGKGGNDILIGGDGNDGLAGGPGNDVLLGEGGDDLLVARDGVSGNDTLDGGAGADQCRADAGDPQSDCP